MSTTLTDNEQALLDTALDRRTTAVSGLFARLLPIQWVAAVVLAVLVTPRTWSGAESAVHLHLWAGILLGGLIALPAAWMAWKKPTELMTRLCVGAAEMLLAALYIHLTGGRIETHFFIFVMLAILGQYPDFRVVLTAAAVIAVDHLLRSIFYPDSLFGVSEGSIARVVEHAAYVVLEAGVLIWSCLRRVDELRDQACQHAEVQEMYDEVQAARRAHEALQAQSETDRKTMLRDLLQGLDQEIKASIEEVEQTASGLTSSAQHLNQVAAQNSDQAAMVATASNEASTNVDEVSVATGELSAASRLIAEQVALSLTKIDEAVAVAQETDRSVRTLAETASRIDQFADEIKDLAEKTNLLALNATIEAQRAGEAGRGFAVVADEVKKLASYTANSANRVAEQTVELRAVGQTSLKALEAVGLSISAVKDTSTGIAAAIEEQDVTTANIAESVRQASAGSAEVTRNVSSVEAAAQSTRGAADQVLSASNGLAEQAALMRQSVERFVTQMSADL